MTKEGAKDLEETLATSQELGEDHVDHGEGIEDLQGQIVWTKRAHKKTSKVFKLYQRIAGWGPEEGRRIREQLDKHRDELHRVVKENEDRTREKGKGKGKGK